MNHFDAYSGPQHSGRAAGPGWTPEDTDFQAALEASRLEAALATGRRTAGRATSCSEEERQLQAALQLSVQHSNQGRGPAASSWTSFLDNSRDDEQLARALQQSERDSTCSSTTSNQHIMPSCAGSQAGPCPLPSAPAGWDPFTFDSATPAQLGPAFRPQPPRPARPSHPVTQPSQHHQQIRPPAAVGFPAAPQAPHPDAADTTDDEALARALQASLNAAEAPSPAAPARSPPRPSPSQAQQPPSQQAAGLNGACAGCGRSLPGFWSLGQTIQASGRRYHAACFICADCRGPLGTGVFTQGQDQQLYHQACHKKQFHPKCAVCADFLPQQNGMISWVTWALQDKCCPSHSTDGTHRCCGCSRLCPRGETWAEVQPSRFICLACLDSIVVDTQDAQPLYTKVLAFFAKLGMPLPERPPLLLVDSESLGNAREVEGDCSHGQPHSSPGAPTAGPVLHTRGLCLWQEHRTVRTVMRRGQGGNSFWSTMPQVVQLPESRSEITAIMVLCGLPWLLTGSIIAHEVMHAWLRLSGYPRLPPNVEEGLCQLMAMLWLEQQPAEPEGTWAERLLSLCAHSIRTDRSPVYGDGFRSALEAFQELGLPGLLADVKQRGDFPAQHAKA